jgi:mono/diheme cytochrome c family protein
MLGAVTRSLIGRLGLVAAMLIQSGGAALAQTTSLERGRALVQQDCAQCHAIGATGDSPYQSAPRFRELQQRIPLDGLSQALTEGTIFGHPQMPPFKFSPDQVQDIIEYLKSIQARQPT